jgi:hypothetical protein
LAASFATLGITLAVLAPAASTDVSAQAASWDAADDFSATSNPNGAWSYGWSVSRGSAFNVDTVATTVSGLNVWTNSSTQIEPDVAFNGTSGTINSSGTNPIPAGSLAFHPGPSGENAIVRWTAPSTGSYDIAATFTGRDNFGPTTTDVAVLSNGTQLWAGEVSAYLATQSIPAARLNLNAGDTIDFTVGYGIDGTYSYDTTGLSAGISLVDTTPPVVSIATPVQGATYTLGQTVIAAYACNDPDSTLVTCSGPVPDGSPIDTATTGSKTFTVVGTDQANNQASASVKYSVGYGICWLYDQTKAVHSGATVPIKLTICDSGNTDQSSSTITVTAVALTQVATSAPETVDSAGDSNPDNKFRFDSTLGTNGGYIFNLSTAGLATGTYALSFTVSGDPTLHSALFDVN